MKKGIATNEHITIDNTTFMKLVTINYLVVFLTSLLEFESKIYKRIILSVQTFGCKIWSLTLSEEHRLKAFENKILGPKWYKRGEWGMFRNEKLHCLYHSDDVVRSAKSRKLRWARIGKLGLLFQNFNRLGISGDIRL